MDFSPLFPYSRNRDVWLCETDEDDDSVAPYKIKSEKDREVHRHASTLSSCSRYKL
jgi:hypothetical protein